MKVFVKYKKRIDLFVAVVFLVILLISSIFILINKNKVVQTMSNVDIYQDEVENKKDEKPKQIEEESDDITSIEQLQEVKEEITNENIEEQPKQQEQKNTKIINNKKFYIKVNIQANVVTIYKNNESGEYEPLKAMVCSIGTYTPKSGRYIIGGRWEWLGLFGNVFGHYVTQITGDILFHSVPYTAWGDNGTLEWWEYDKLGSVASMGCVRLQISDAKWIFDNIERGTIVEFYSDSNPGPLGKPYAIKISQNEECRNYDPTDPADNNPWKNYYKKQEELKKQEEEKKRQEELEKPEDNDKNKEDIKNQEENQIEIYNKIENEKEKDIDIKIYNNDKD